MGLWAVERPGTDNALVDPGIVVNWVEFSEVQQRSKFTRKLNVVKYPLGQELWSSG